MNTKEFTIIKNATPPTYRPYRSNRQALYNAMREMEIGDGIEVEPGDYMNVMMGIRHAARNSKMHELRGFSVQSFRQEHGNYILIRTA